MAFVRDQRLRKVHGLNCFDSGLWVNSNLQLGVGL